MKILLRQEQLLQCFKKAKAAAKKGGQEICGLMIFNGYIIDLIHVRNKSKKNGSYSYYYKEIRDIQKSVDRLGYEIVGSFHSHPYSPAKPGIGDISGALDKDYMLIFSVPDVDIKLWYLSGGRKYKRKFELI